MEPNLIESRERARVTEHHIENTGYTKYPGNYHGYADEWSIEEFKNQFEVNIINYKNGKELEYDMIGLNFALANAYRRIMIAEIPTMCIEHCFIYNNTSVIQDEMLAHRLGMIPLRVDPTLFKWKPINLDPAATSSEHTLLFTLKAKCKKLPNADPEKTGRRDDLYRDYKVYSGHLQWHPLKGQEKLMAPRPVHSKILIAKLSNNQEIDVKLHAIKGVGRDHAKFSPVATATYRLMPDISLKEKISGDEAIKLKESFSAGVIKLSDRDKVAKVVNSRIDSGSRNIFRFPDLAKKIKYDLIKDHFIFNVESTGCMPAMDIVLQACSVLDLKCKYFLKELQNSRFGVKDPATVVEGV